MTYLGAIWIAYGFVHQKQHVYLATGLLPPARTLTRKSTIWFCGPCPFPNSKR